ncbi:RNA polymerase III subunit C82 [Exophiala oligosperma]
MRTGKLAAIAQRHFGTSAAIVVEHLSTLGFATAEELEDTICADKDFKTFEDHGPQTNGSSGNQRTHDLDSTRSRFRKVLRSLIDEKYIVGVRDAHFQSLFDARRELERHLESRGLLPSSKTKKSQPVVDDKINVDLEQLLDPAISASTILHELQSSRQQGAKTLLCVDYSNVVSSVRNERIASTAGRIFGKTPSHIAKAACAQVELSSSPFKVRPVDDRNDAIQRLDVSLIDVHLSGLSNGSADLETEQGSSYNSHLVNGHHHSRPNGTRHDPFIDQQLGILAEGPFPFITQDVGGSWLVNKKELGDLLREEELMRLMGERVDPPALRIVRMLHDKGKLDEKTLQELGLLGAKDLRQCLSQLQVMGFLELQEVPRDPQRQPNRTLFLWFYDAERVRKVLLGKIYKTMARHYQRMHLEREKLASTLSKVERTDVEGNVQDLLPEAELELLYTWQQKEAWFITELNRMDDSVAILRDL